MLTSLSKVILPAVTLKEREFAGKKNELGVLKESAAFRSEIRAEASGTSSWVEAYGSS